MNTETVYKNQIKPEFTESLNIHKMIGSVSKDKIEILDYVMF